MELLNKTFYNTSLPLVYDPEEDGITHINIWYLGKTELGKMLSHFYKSPFHHPYFGTFNSMEGFWHYLQSINSPDDAVDPNKLGPDGNPVKVPRDTLRSLSGNAAKQYGKKLKWSYVDRFYEIISAANFYKIEQNPVLKKLFIESTLPFDLYYLNPPIGDAEGQRKVLTKLVNYKWLVDSFEENRILMQYKERPMQINYDEIINNPKKH